MKEKIINGLLIIFSLFGYLEWGTNSNSFLFEGEYEVLRNLFKNFDSAVHPLTIIPLVGQILLVVSLFQKKPDKTLTYTGISCLTLLLGFMFFIGIIGMKFKILISTIPFLVTAIFALLQLRKQKQTNPN